MNVDTQAQRRLRAAIIAPSLRYVGGQSAQAETLLQLWKNDPDVEVRFIAVDPLFPRGLSWLTRIPGLRTLAREPLYVSSLWRSLKNMDVAHIFSASYWSFLLAVAPAVYLARARGVKTIVHYHSGEARDHMQRFRSARHVLLRAHRLIVPSGYLVDVFKEYGLPAAIVPNVVDLSQFKFRVREPLVPRLICTRAFSEYYRVDLVIRAFAEIQRVHSNAQLTLVGDGPLRAELLKLVADLDLKGVHFAGVASRAEIFGHYDRADIFINASSLDNMPVSVIEAFASGTPVVSTSPECMPYFIEHERTGLLCPVGDHHALATQVLRLLRETGLAGHLVRNALAQVHQYTWSQVREQWLRAYESTR